MNEGYLKYFGVLLCLFAIAAIIPPASAYMACGDFEGDFSYTGAIPGTEVYSNYSGTDTFLRYDWFKTGLVYPVDFIGFGANHLTMWSNETYIAVYTLNQSSACEHRLDRYYLYGGVYLPNANFTATPLSGTAPLTVSFTDTSRNITGGEIWNWSVSPAPGVSITTPAAQNTQMTFAAIGNYTIAHGMSNPNGSSINTKTDYIYVYNSTATFTTYFYTYNPLSNYEIHNSNIYLKDIENSSWVNSTNDPDGRLGITTLNSHHIYAYGTATGFEDADILSQIADGLSYPIIMYPTNITNVSAGSVTLYVSVLDTWAPGTPVDGATVNLAYDTPDGQFNDYRTTNSAGLASFTVPNQTLVYLYAEKPGYTSGGSTVNTGNGNGGSASVSAIVYITKTVVTPTITPTYTGSVTPTPRITVDPYPCDADHPDNCKRKQTDLANLLIANGEMLFYLFLIATVVGVMKMMGSKR